VKRVEKLADKLEERRNSSGVGKVEEFQKMMRRLAQQRSAPDTPVTEFAKNLAQGDFKGAQEALRQIQEQLSKEPKTPQERQQAEQMKAQLKELSDRIAKIAQDE